MFRQTFYECIKVKVMAISAAVLLVSGCASIMSGTTQSVTVDSEPQGAKVMVGNVVNEWRRTMKQMMRACCVLLFAAGFVPNAIADQDNLKVEVGFGVVISPDYRDLLEDAYPNTDLFGGYGWLNFHLGLRYQANEQFSVTPTLGILFNYVAVNDPTANESYLNSIVVPALSGRYMFHQAPSPYLGGEESVART